MRSFSRHARCALLLGTCLASAAQAQNHPDNAHWTSHAELVARPGSYETGASAELFVPLAQDEDTLLFFDGRVGATTRSDYLGNLGLGIRHVAGRDLVVGGYVFADATRTEAGNDFYGATIGAEILTSDFDLRANFYLPVTDEQLVSDTVGPSILGISGNRIVENFSTQRIDETAMTGVDVEAGVRLFGDEGSGSEFRLYGAVYHYWADQVDSVTGGRGRAEFRVNDLLGAGSYLALGAEVSEDDQRGTEVAGDIRLRIPFGGSARNGERRMSPIRRRAAERVRRELPIRTSDIVTGGSFDINAINPVTGQEFGLVFFADGANTVGSGDPDDPTTLDDAVTRAGANGIIVGEGNNGTIATGGVTLAGGQALVGGGTSVQVRLQSGAVQPFTLGQAAGTVSNSGAGTTVTLGSGNLVQNLGFTGGTTAIAGSGEAGVTLAGVTVSGTTGPGVTLADMGATTISGSDIAGGNGALAVSGATQLALSDTTLSASGGDVVSLSGITVTQLADVMIEGGNGETGGLIAANVVFDDVEGGDLAIGSAGARVGGDGLYLDQVSGSLAFGDLSIFTDGGTGLYIRDAGGKAGTFAFTNASGTIDAMGGAAVDIDPVTMNSVFESITSTGSPGAGLFFDTVAGNFTVTGTTSVTDSAGASIDINNSSATFSFGTTMIVNPGFKGGIFIGGINGDIGFGDVDITGLGGGTGVDVSGAIGDVGFATLDIAGTGAAGSVGIDMSGSTNTGTIGTTGSSHITGVDIGVDISNANITGAFQFGDGSDTDTDGAASTIVATTPIAAANLGTTGTFNFLDTVLVGDTSALSDDEVTIFFVDTTAGAGTAADPGTIAQAEASGADIVVLVNDGLGTLDSAGSGADNTLLLADGQRLTGFFGQTSFDYVQGGPQANLMIHGFSAGQTITVDDPTGNGGATLISTGGDALSLSGNNLVDHVIIGPSLGDGIAIDAVSGATMISNAQISSLGIDGGSGIVSVAASSLTGSTGRVLSVTGGHSGSVTVDAASSVTDTTGTGILFDNAAGTYTIDAPVALTGGGILINASPGSFAFNGNVTVTNATVDAVSLTGANGDISFSTLDIVDPAARGIEIIGAANGVTFADVSINDTATTGGFGVTIQDQTASSTISFATLDLQRDDDSADSFNVQNSAGTITVTAGTFSNASISDLVDIDGGSATITIGAALADTGIGNGIEIDGITGGSIIFTDAYTKTGTGNAVTIGTNAALTGGAIDFQGALTVSGGADIAIQNAAGTTSFADVSIDAPAGNALDITGANGALTFGDVTIAGLGAATGVDLTGASGDVTFASLDITGTGAVGSVGIDLSGSTNAGDIVTTNPSSIAGVDIGVDISNAAITGSFQFGDGSDTDANGQASTILANTAIDATGIGATGSYNFLDVDFGGANPGGATGVFAVPTFFYFADSAVGLGDGSSAANAGTAFGAQLADANALIVVGAAANAIDVSDLTADPENPTGAFDLDDGQQLLGFADGTDVIDLGIAGPANILLSASLGQATNLHTDGSPALTQGLAGGTVLLANGNIIRNITIDNSGGGFMTLGLTGSGFSNLVATDITVTGMDSGVRIVSAGGSINFTNLTIDTTTGIGVQLLNNSLATISFNGLDLTTTSGTGFSATGGGTINVTDTSSVTTATGQIVNLSDVSVGTSGIAFQTLTRTGTGALTGVFLSNVDGTGTFDGGDVIVAGSSGFADGIAILNGSAATFTFASATIGGASAIGGDGIELTGANGAVIFDTVAIDNVGLEGIRIAGATNAIAVNGGAIGATDDPAGNGVSIVDGTGDITIAADVSKTTAGNIVLIDNHETGTVTFSGTLDSTSGGILVQNVNSGAVNFTGAASLDTGTGAAVVLTGNTGGTIAFSGGLDITTTSGTGFQATGGGTVSVTGAGNTITTQTGQLLNLATGTIGTGGVTFGTLTATGIGGANTVALTSMSGGAFSGGAVSIAGSAGDAVHIANSSADVSFASLDIANAAGDGVELAGNSGSFSVAGLADISGAAGTGLNIHDLTGTVAFTQTMVSSGTTAVDLSGTNTAAISFADLDIALTADNAIGFSIAGAAFGAAVTATDFDLTSTSATGTIGVDLRGATSSSTVRLGDNSMPFADGADATITGVATGVILDNASDIDFVFGDGEGTADVDSVISAAVAIDFTDATGANGTFNFLDVTFPVVGSTTNLESGIDIFYADAGIDGTDNGSRTNPGQLNNAAAGTADVIVLVNQNAGGTDTIDLATGNQGGINTLNLNDGQVLVSFDAGETVDLADYGLVASGAPSNILLTGITSGGTLITNPGDGMGAPILTTSAAGANVITLADGSTTQIGGIVIGASAGANAGIFGNDFVSVTIRDSLIAGPVFGFLGNYALNAAGTTSSITVIDSMFTGGTGAGFFVSSGAGDTVTVDLSDSGFASTDEDGLHLSGEDGAIFAALDGITGNSVSGRGIFLNNAGTGGFTITQLFDISVGSAGTGGLVIAADDPNAEISFDADTGTLGLQAVSGGDVTIGAPGTPVTGVGLSLVNVAGELNFGNIDIETTGGAGLNVNNDALKTAQPGLSLTLTSTGGTINSVGAPALFLDPLNTDLVLDSVTSTNSATDGIFIDAVTGVGAGGNALTIGTLNVTGSTGRGVVVQTSTGGYTFGNPTITDTGDTSVLISGGSSAVTFLAGGGGLSQANNALAFNVSNHTGSLTWSTTMDVTNGGGLSFTGADGTYLFDADDGAGGTRAISLNGGAARIQVGTGSDGTFTFGADTEIVNPSAVAFEIASNQADVDYAGTITQENDFRAVSIVGHRNGTIDFSGLITVDTLSANPIHISNTSTGAATVSFTGGLDLTTTATGIFISGSTVNGAGKVYNFTGTNNITVNAGSGIGVSMTNATIGDLGATFNSVNVNGAQFGLNLSGVGQTATSTGIDVLGGGITTSIGSVSMSGSSVDLSVAANLTSTAGRTVSLTNSGRTGGQQIVFSGNIDDNGTGISLTNNDQNTDGATITFSGNVDIDIGASGTFGFQSTNGGNVVVTGPMNVNTTGGTATAIGVNLTGNTGSAITFNSSGPGLDIVTGGGIGLQMTGGGTLQVLGSDNSITTATGRILNLTDSEIGAGGVSFVSLTSTGTVALGSNQAVLMFDNVDGAGTFNGGTVSIAGSTGASGDGIRFLDGSAATFSFGATTIGSAGDDGIDISGTNGAITFASTTIDNAGVTSLNTGHGIALLDALGTITINGGTITNGAGNGVDISGNTGNVTIGANITKTTATGLLVNIFNHDAGNVDFSGNLSANGGAGIVVSSSDGGSITFSGASKVLGTGANTAVSLQSNGGSTVSFTNGGLDIDTTTGTGLNITGGTVNVTGPNNSITTQTGQPILVDTNGQAILLDLDFASVSTTGTSTQGMDFRATGTGSIGGSVDIAGGSITTNGRGLRLDGTTLDFSYGGSLTANTLAANRRAFEIANHSAGDIVLSGNIVDTASGSTITNMTGGTFTHSGDFNAGVVGTTAGLTISNVNPSTATIGFTGAIKRFNTTGAQGAIAVTAGGAAVSFTGGGLDIDTEGGGGIGFGGSGGSLTVSGVGNTINTDTGTGISLSGAGTVSINSNVTTHGAGTLASIANRTGGAATLSGNFNTANDLGTGLGITVQNNTGGSVDFSGTSKILTTGNNVAVRIQNNSAGVQTNFTNGGLVINTTAGQGYLASSGGTITVTGTGNTITSTTGIPLNVINTTIGAAGLNFESISANGAANGIVLNNTGTAGGLTVTGDGSTANSGGIIQNTVGAGISLTNTSNVSLNWIRIADTLSDGIAGSQVHGFRLTNSTIFGAGDGDEENGIIFGNDNIGDGPITTLGVDGIVHLQNVLIDGNNNGTQWGVRIYNNDAAATLNLTADNLTIQNNQFTFGESGLSLRIESGTARVLVDNSDFLHTDGPGIDGQSLGTGILHLTVQNSVFDDNRALPMAVNFVTDNSSQGYLRLHNNTVTDPVTPSQGSIAFDLDANRTSTLHAIVTNNTVNGTGIGSAMEFVVGDGASGRAEVRDNTFNLNAGEIGATFHVRSEGFGGNNGSLHVTFEGNTITGVSDAGLFNPAVQFLAGSSTGTHDQDLFVNISTANGAGGNTLNGTNNPGFTPRFEVTQRTGTSFTLQGFAGDGTNATTVGSFFDSNNPSSNLDPTFVRSTGTAIVNYTSGTVLLPTAPTLPTAP